jgi:hydroxyethylthiazole kinase
MAGRNPQWRSGLSAMTLQEAVWRDVERVRAASPLVHNITNFVVMNTTANALLALGASPVMAHALEEVEEMARMARALVLNIGTLSGPWIEAMLRAGRAAQAAKIPVVLDPVGSGATGLRTTTARRLLESVCPAIVRGNASEIASLAGQAGATKGVDSTRSTHDVLDAAQALARAQRCVVVVSGATDAIVDGRRIARVHNGHALMPRVTGMGCTASALVGAFAAVNPSPFDAAVHGMALMGIAGEIAAEGAAGPGSLQLRFLDVLSTISEADIAARARIQTD